MNSAASSRQRGDAKRQAVLDGARAVFGRDGYTRASIEAIALEAGVSTRTIYNHFRDKQRLFEELIVESASEVRDAQITQIERHIGKIEDLKADLVALGRDLVLVRNDFGPHFALVRQIQAEADHLPREILEAWRDAGPKSVHRALSETLARLADRGFLTIEDPERAAYQFVALVSAEVSHPSFLGASLMDPTDIEKAVESGVATFLRAFGAPSQDA